MSAGGDDTAYDGSYYPVRIAYRQMKAYRASLTPPRQSINGAARLYGCEEFVLSAYSRQRRFD